MSTENCNDRFNSITVSLTIHNAKDALAFYAKAFGFTDKGVFEADNGKIMHAEMQFRDSVIMISDDFPEYGAKGIQDVGAVAGLFRLCVPTGPEVDALYNQAVAAGATALGPVQDQFWGDRSGDVKDPFGYRWSIAARIESPSLDEIKRRMSKFSECPSAK